MVEVASVSVNLMEIIFFRTYLIVRAVVHVHGGNITDSEMEEINWCFIDGREVYVEL